MSAADLDRHTIRGKDTEMAQIDGDATEVAPGTLVTADGSPARAERPRLAEMPIGTGEWTLEEILSLTQREGIELWGTLPAPTLEEVHGHYAGLIPDHQGAGLFMFNEQPPIGYWLGKAFRPLDGTVGEGYNRWRFPGGRVERNLRMATRRAPSIIDGQPCFVLDYGAVNPSMSLYDELRKLDDGVLIGTATTALPDGARSPLTMFVLVGPTDEWVGAPYATDDGAHQRIFG